MKTKIAYNYFYLLSSKTYTESDREHKGSNLQGRKVLLETSSGRQNEASKGRRGLEGSAQQLGMILDTNEVRVARHLDNLHTLASLILADKLQPLGVELVDHLGVDLVSMAVTFQNLGSASVQLTNRRALGALLERCGLDANPERSS